MTDTFLENYNTLTREQKSIVETLVFSLAKMNNKANSESPNKKAIQDNGMTKEKTLALFEELAGSLNVPADFDWRKEKVAYLEEKYGL
ncbi:MAG: hypothetical protein IJU92_04855 [Spirochaetaceae bacterium]|nr:hypothetical protein [Spirochaetaceae bacterium]